MEITEYFETMELFRLCANTIIKQISLLFLLITILYHTLFVLVSYKFGNLCTRPALERDHATLTRHFPLIDRTAARCTFFLDHCYKK